MTNIMDTQTYFYIVKERGTIHFKIGVAYLPETRIKAHQVGNPRELKLVFTALFEDRYTALRVEKHIIKKLEISNIRSEWYIADLEELKELFFQVCEENNIDIMSVDNG